MNSSQIIKFINSEFLGAFDPEIPYTRKSTIKSIERLIEHLAYYLNAKNSNQDAKDRKYYNSFIMNIKPNLGQMIKIMNDNGISINDNNELWIGDKSIQIEIQE